MKANTILVPTDFSPAADVASKHAVLLANIFDGKIVFLHITNKPSEQASAESKMDQYIKGIESSHSVKCEGVVKTGSIFEDIGDFAEDLSAKFIVMGTHGVKGMQKITGSYAIKVITSSKIPFIVVQEKTLTKSGYNNIVLPLDLSIETKQKIGYSAEIAKKFNSTIHILVPKTTDKELLVKVKRNVTFARNFLTEKGIESRIKVAESGAFSKEILSFSKNCNADLIAIMNAGDNFVFASGAAAKQSILTNEHMVPVLCVNPVDTAVAFWK